MNRMRTMLAWTSVLLVGLAANCAAGPGNPEEEYRQAMQALYRGDLVGFYERLVPPSYDRDLNSLLNESRQLLSPEEFEKARRLLNSFSDRLAAQIQSRAVAEQAALVGLLAQSLHDIPSQLGLGSYEELQQATIKSIIEHLQQAALGEALRDPSIPVSWSRQEVALVEQSDKSARLRVTPEGDAASPDEEEYVDLVLIEGKWVPSRLASQWEERIGQLRSWLETVESRQQDDPQYISRQISALGQRLELLTLLVTDILETLAGQAPEN